MKTVVSLDSRVQLVANAVSSICRSGKYTEGMFRDVFENDVEKLYPGMHAVSFNSAGSGLFALARCFRDRNDNWPLAYVQNNTFFATGAMFGEAGYSLMLIDSAKDHPGIGVEQLSRAIASFRPPKVVVMTHIGGWLSKEYFQIAEMCSSRGIPLIEDASHCFGTFDKDVGAGTYGDAAVFSFYPTKAVPIGEAGVVITKRADLAKALRKFRNYGKTLDNGHFVYEQGFNFRLDEWSAAVGCVQLSQLDKILAARAADAKKLEKIAPCLLSGPTNWYKYPVDKKYAGKNLAGQVFSVWDQLHKSCRAFNPYFGELQNSIEWSESHVCLPIGEGIYNNVSDQELKGFLC